MRIHKTKLGPRFSEGARQLWLRMMEQNLSQAEVARRIEAPAGYVNGLLYGKKGIGIIYADRIRGLFGIDPPLWLKPPTVEFRPPAAVTEAAS